MPVLVGHRAARAAQSLELWWRDGQEFGAERMHFGTALRERFGAPDTYTFANACSAVAVRARAWRPT